MYGVMVALQILVLSVQVRILVSQPWRFPGNRLIFFGGEFYLKKRWRRKPVSVFKSVIYLRNLPPGNGRATLDCQYIWSCRARCRTRDVSPRPVVSSCLTFSPLPLRAVIFCYGLHKIAPICAFHSGLPFPVRTFLSA